MVWCGVVRVWVFVFVGEGKNFRTFHGSGGFQNVAGRVGSDRVRRCSNCHGSGRINNFSNLAGRVGSGQEFFKISRVRSGQVATSKKNRGSGRVR